MSHAAERLVFQFGVLGDGLAELERDGSQALRQGRVAAFVGKLRTFSRAFQDNVGHMHGATLRYLDSDSGRLQH